MVSKRLISLSTLSLVQCFASKSKARQTLQLVYETGKGVSLGRLLLGGCSTMGLAAMAYYSSGYYREERTIDRVMRWPDLVSERVKHTLVYLSGSFVVTAASTYILSQSSVLMDFVCQGSWSGLFYSLATLWGLGAVSQSTLYRSSRLQSSKSQFKKHLLWLVHCVAIGGMIIGPLARLMDSRLLKTGLFYGGATIKVLTLLALVSPSECYMNLAEYIPIGSGEILSSGAMHTIVSQCASVLLFTGAWFVPPTSSPGEVVYYVAIYLGMVFFPIMLLYDTQKLFKNAEMHPVMSDTPFDPINNCMGYYLDCASLFVQVISLLSTADFVLVKPV